MSIVRRRAPRSGACILIVIALVAMGALVGWFAAAASGILTGLSLLWPLQEGGGEPLSSRIPPRTIASNTLAFSEVWRQSDLLSPHGGMPTGMLASESVLVLVTSDPNGPYAQAQAFNSATGAKLWAISGLPYVHSMALDEQRLYLAVSWQIRVYALETGRLLWSSEELPGHSNYLVYPAINDRVTVYSTRDDLDHREQTIRYYDPKSGALTALDRISLASGERIRLRTSTGDFLTRDSILRMTEGPSGVTKWEIATPLRVNDWLTPLRGDVLLTYGIFPRLEAIDLHTGLRRWLYPQALVSNFVVDGDVLYAIRRDAALVSIDTITGQELGIVGFQPLNTEEDTRETAYWIGAAGDRIFLYYGDSREIICLARSTPTRQ